MTPLDQTRILVATLGALVTRGPHDPELDLRTRRANAQVFKRLDAFMDYGSLVDGPIVPHRSRFTASELRLFRERFREVIRRSAFPSAATALGQARQRLKPSRRVSTGGDRADVVMMARFAGETRDSEIVFHWRAREEHWVLVDLSMEGSSLVVSYERQFAKLLAEGTVERLLEKLRERLAEKEREGLLPP